MDHMRVYQDIKDRTRGEIYIGVVGPVRTGKSTFVRRFLEILALPQLEETAKKELMDQLPLSGEGKMITTVEPKFIPKDAVTLNLGQEQEVKIRLIDCVGFPVKEADGSTADGKERMVKTPWSKSPVPFCEAAQEGTSRVIREHSTIGILVTTDGSFGELSRQNFMAAEERTVTELKKEGKPFLILLNSQTPYREDTKKLAQELGQKYQTSVLPANCEQLKREDITRILESVLYEFPVSEMRFYIPKWVEMLPNDHELKSQILSQVREKMKTIRCIRQVTKASLSFTGPYVCDTRLDSVRLSDGTVDVLVSVDDKYYYRMLSGLSGISMENEYELVNTMRELSAMKAEYVKVQAALSDVRQSGYGVVVPELSEISLKEPEVIRQGNKFGVKIRSESPSIHMIRANIETEIAPIVGTEQQAKDLISYIGESQTRGESIWETNIFGKSIEQLVQDGIRAKLSSISGESQEKLQNTMQKIVNDSRGGMICIII